MLTYILLISFTLSFSVHICILFIYLLRKEKIYFILFLATAFLNMIIAMTLMFIALQHPEKIRTINLQKILWMFSGVVTFLLLFVKIVFFIRIFARTKNPDNYHLNYFGKKVYHASIIKKSEFILLLITIPFFLMIGAYFTARLMNFLLYGRL